MAEQGHTELNDCCYKAVFGGKDDGISKYTARRLGRCHYICDYCGADISMMMAFYFLSSVGERKLKRKKISMQK